jgi:hypothetical protein
MPMKRKPEDQDSKNIELLQSAAVLVPVVGEGKIEVGMH